ncbi:hypothetical protein GOBAR_DD20888 [Gossypium barbadense]|nr:hypothetical protein GOBAR_DD20888 [Gossypium barbadense]
MTIRQFKDVESGEINGLEDLEKPLIGADDEKIVVHHENGSIWMVLLCTFVAVCGSFEFGSCVGYSALTQSAISEDLNLSLSEAMRLSAGFCITGWLAVYFSKDLCHAFSCLLASVSESPRWLAKVGQNKEFQVALRKLRGKDADITQEAAEIQIGVALMVFQQFGGINGISFYASETFASAGLSSGKAGTIAYACVQVPITVVGAMLMDKSGRRPLIMVSATGTFLGCFMSGTSFYLKEHNLLPEWVPILAVGGVLIYVASFSIGMGAVPWVIMSEIFPINIKGVAGSLVVLVNWLGAWAVSYTFNFLMSWSSSGTFFIYSGFSLMTILYVAKFVPETKGKTLEEIQACINS